MSTLALRARARAAPWLVPALELGLLVLILAEFARLVLRLIGLDVAVGWDEAVYALRARGWVDADAPVSGWSDIRPPLLPLVETLPVLAGGDEWQLRLVGLLAGIGLLLTGWWLARSIAGPMAGIGVAAILVMSPTLQQESALALTDVPATALLLLSAALVWRELELRERPGWGLAVAVAVAGLAFLMRYGSIVVLVPMLVATVAIWWRRLSVWPREALAALAVGAVFAIGHAGWSVLATGSPIGIILAAQEIVATYPGERPADLYRQYLPLQHAGSVGHVVIYAGLGAIPLAAFGAVHDAAWGRPLRASVFLVVPALVQVVLLTRGIGHVEPRFFVASTALFVVAGVSVAVLLIRILPPAFRFGIAVAFVAAVVAYRGPSVDRAFEATLAGAGYHEQLRVIGRTIGDLAGDNCGVLSGGYTMVAWYSGCEGQPLRFPDQGGSPWSLLVAGERWAVLPPARVEVADPLAAAILDDSLEPPMLIRHPDTGREIAVALRWVPS